MRSAWCMRPRNEEVFGLDALHGMHYLHATLTESMRLYPPVHIDSLSCAADDTLPNGVQAGVVAW
jgi:cytochrome P450